MEGRKRDEEEKRLREGRGKGRGKGWEGGREGGGGKVSFATSLF
jgi:hypothetical protein